MPIEYDGPLPSRSFGHHGDRVSIIGLGGGHLQRAEVPEEESVRIIRAALDGGINFLDTAWCYGYGESERRIAKAIEGRRDGVFLMTKVCARDRQAAAEQIDESLLRLRVDHVDLLQIHETNFDNDPDWVFEPGGAMEAVIAARKAGKTRYIGFTGHKSPHILLRMLEMDFEWDSCQMPVNVMDGLFRSFEGEVLPELVRGGIACLGMKSLGGEGQFVSDAGIEAGVCRRYSLSRPIATLICGVRTMGNLRQDLEIGRSFEPLSAGEEERIRALIRRSATDGRHEWFKTTNYFDHAYHRSQHGFPAHAEARRSGAPSA